ncbi:hypothetical protein P167DRAFT_70126 [Morchella conica CCBAS932]|uniref:Uncharacterized protein n=1 Tax=Morchella conica CCBAS932 TaxID=1392247 RepID=A0A3N4KYW2_9PEZI|nr:hypothetical protein P167DRAFT_70126 [Morchella conica CCBAS932]
MQKKRALVTSIKRAIDTRGEVRTYSRIPRRPAGKTSVFPHHCYRYLSSSECPDMTYTDLFICKKTIRQLISYMSTGNTRIIIRHPRSRSCSWGQTLTNGSPGKADKGHISTALFKI